jgi:hypothetical protein
VPAPVRRTYAATGLVLVSYTLGQMPQNISDTRIPRAWQDFLEGLPGNQLLRDFLFLFVTENPVIATRGCLRKKKLCESYEYS